MATPLNLSTLYSSLATISPQDYSSLPKSPSELTPFLTITIEAAQRAVSSIPAHPSAANPTPENNDIEKLYKSVKLPTTPPPSGDMKLWKFSASDGKGVWFARKSVHGSIGFERFRRGLDVEFALKESGLEGMERQEVPEGRVDSVRGIGCIERVGEKVVEGGGEVGLMEVYHLAAQFPGPTAAREFVTVCCKKQGREKIGGGRWYMIVSMPVKVGDEIEGICPSKVGSGYIRGEYESVELIREVVPEGEGEELVAESEVWEDTVDEGENADVDDEIVEAASQSREVRNYPIEWVMLSRSDPGGSVPRWMVERGTPGSIVKDAEKFLKWLRGLSDEQLGLNSPWGRNETSECGQRFAISATGSVVKEEEGGQETPIEENVQKHEEWGNKSLVSNIFGIAGEMVSPIVTKNILPNMPNILGRYGGAHNNTNDSSSAIPQQRLSPIARSSNDAASVQSFSTAAQDPIDPGSPSLTSSSASAELPITPLSTPSTLSATGALPPPNDAESKSLSRLLSQQTRLIARLEKALQKNRRGKDAEAKLRQRYEEEVRREEERYKRDMEKLGRKKEREAQKLKEKEQKQREKRQRGADKKERKKRVGSSSNASQAMREAMEVVERLTRENEMLVREKEELMRRISVLEAEAGRN
ncbi:hypothetical protein L211DRAFT_4735 [Terfezia boudieri ATCC MYA-4762]|uniref:DUF3074 domain-containing protein n=1 Tax=Terfezia boudieri ATCC MYA-4762 TaxID=1051890 RepID=A0A3N4M2D8_9PEZI|nr:hypothetical protein L211DRAFT_4735 [Terfezia boudieri ATCC MYA-4762]